MVNVFFYHGIFTLTPKYCEYDIGLNNSYFLYYQELIMSKKKNAFVIFAGEKEAGRVYHALAYAKQAHARGDDVEVYFGAEGTYWPGVLSDRGHSMYALYQEVSQAGVIVGACQNCAVAFGHVESTTAACGLVQGPEDSFGQIDVLGLENTGWRVWLF